MTDKELFTVLKTIDHNAKRLPPGIREFALAVIEAYKEQQLKLKVKPSNDNNNNSNKDS